MKSITIPEPAKHNIKLFVIPEERLKGIDIMDIEIINTGKEKYTIEDYYTVEKNDIEPFPTGLMLLATGQIFKKDVVFSNFKKSNKLYFVIGRQSNE